MEGKAGWLGWLGDGVEGKAGRLGWLGLHQTDSHVINKKSIFRNGKDETLNCNIIILQFHRLEFGFKFGV